MPVPSDMYFESVVQPEHNGWLLLDSLCARFTYHSREDWTEKLNRGLVSINGETATLVSVAHKNDKVVYHVENYTEPEVPTEFDVVFEDDEFMVIAKPAGVPVHHTGRIFYNTFTSIVRRGTDCETATPMHRLDRDTGGLMLFAKYSETAARFQKNLDRILLKKFYMAVVRGEFPDETVDCQMPLREDPSDCLRLRMHHLEDGKPCHTIFRKVGAGVRNAVNEVGETCLEPYSVVECELITGRKHQIRTHLSELGFPILGDRLYSFGGRYYEKMSDNVAAARARGELNQEDALSAEDFAVLGAKSQMLYAYKAVIQLPYWKEPRVFISENFPEEMKVLAKV